MFFLGSLSI